MMTDQEFEGVPLDTEVPGDNVPQPAPGWLKFISGTGEGGVQSFEYASARVQQRGSTRKLCTRIWNTMRQEFGRLVLHSVGSRVFWPYDWKWWGVNFEGRTARIRVTAVYPNPFTLPNGDGAFAQVMWEFKTLDQPTAVQVLLRQADNGRIYHYLSLAGVIYGLGTENQPLEFGVPVEYMLIVDFKRTADAKVTLIVNNRLIATGTGRTLNATNGYGNGALLAYSNELQDQELAIEYSDFEVARSVASNFVAQTVREEMSDEEVAAWVAENKDW
jgi:hypothetical protein